MMLIVLLGILMIGRSDEKIIVRKNQWCMLGVTAIAQEMVILISVLCMIAREDMMDAERGLICYSSLSVFGGCLLLACITDWYSCQVYNFVWWIAILSQSALLWCRINQVNRIRGIPFAEQQLFVELSIFILCQLLLAGRIYGKADAYAFCSCAMTQAGLGMGIFYFLLQMSVAYGLLFIIQLKKQNVDRRGNLKRPVPFLPYITISFWCTIIFGCFS